MSKTLVLSPAVLLTIVLSVVPGAASMVWWMSDLSTRLEAMEGSIASSDTGSLNDRLTQTQERVQFPSHDPAHVSSISLISVSIFSKLSQTSSMLSLLNCTRSCV